jgi:LPXTG-site transpeptidase (sortase) family protein
MFKYFYLLFLILGISLLSFGFYLLWQSNDPSRLSFTNYKYSATDAKQITEKNLPTQIAIPDVKINLHVLPATVKNNTWQTTDNGASYLTSSPIPGTDGNSIIYAHNWASLFGPLRDVKPGNTVEIEYADKSVKKFAVAYTLTVSPGDASILKNNNDKRITLYTCTGFLDSKRFVAVAFPIN